MSRKVRNPDFLNAIYRALAPAVAAKPPMPKYDGPSRYGDKVKLAPARRIDPAFQSRLKLHLERRIRVFEHNLAHQKPHDIPRGRVERRLDECKAVLAGFK